MQGEAARRVPDIAPDTVREARLRANPRFRLVAFDELEPDEWRAFGSLSEDPDLYELLVPPRDSALPVKAVSKDAALLFLTLRESARVPRLLDGLFGIEADVRVRQLLLDGVFEIESNDRFLSGESALQRTPSAAEEAAPYLVRLSTDAIAYGAGLTGLSVNELAVRLYMFNRAPSTPLLQRRFADTSGTVAYLIGNPELAKLLDTHWTSEVNDGFWLTWRSRDEDQALEYKLYVSPMLEALPEAFRLTVDTLAQLGCARFKVGLSAYGLLRPDKLVAYFSTLDDLREAAELILTSASGVLAHGVPFSAAIDADGLVSWGMDPPQIAQSWRQWVAERIAVYLVTARESAAQDTPDFVLRRLALDGIDTASWTPDLGIWRGLDPTAGEIP